MPEQLQRIIAEPTPVYMVAYRGTLTTGELLVIPDTHQRQGDIEPNQQVTVWIQNIELQDATTPNYNLPYMDILDESNTTFRRVFASDFVEVVTDKRLKLTAGFFTYRNPVNFAVAVFYKKPDR